MCLIVPYHYVHTINVRSLKQSISSVFKSLAVPEVTTFATFEQLV